MLSGSNAEIIVLSCYNYKRATLDEFAEVVVAHILSRGMGVVWVDAGDGAGPPLMSLSRSVSHLMHLKGLPAAAAHKGAVCGLRGTSLVYCCSWTPFYAEDVCC